MPDKRNFMKAALVIAAGATAPDKWVKPTVDSVLLPAHATTSPVPCQDIVTTIARIKKEITELERELELCLEPDEAVSDLFFDLVPSAHALNVVDKCEDIRVKITEKTTELTEATESLRICRGGEPEPQPEPEPEPE